MKPFSFNRKMPLSLAILLITWVFIWMGPKDTRKNSRERLTRLTTRDLIAASSSDTAMKNYKKTDDSLQRIVDWKKERLDQEWPSFSLVFAGMTRIHECDTCAKPDEETHTNKYFISFSGYTLDEGTKIRLDRNDNILERFVAEDPISDSSAGHVKTTRIKFRPAIPHLSQKGITLLLPVSKTLYKILEVLMYLLLIAGLLLGAWIFIISPMRVLKNIANGQPFLPENIRSLNRAGWCAIVVSLAAAIIPKLVQWILAVPKGIHFPFWETLYDFRWGIFTGAAMLLLAQAFRQGNKLTVEKNSIV